MGMPGEVLEYWFGDGGGHICAPEVRDRWFKQSDATDEEIRAQFGDDVAAARRGERDDWAAPPHGRVALLILLDQFTRNLHRGSGEAFAADERAQAHARAFVDGGQHATMPVYFRCFAYMPFMHAEDLALQNRCCDLFAQLAEEVTTDEERETFSSFHKYAIAHRDIVERFGRFPHRNERVGRTSSAEELAFLEQPGSSFG